MSTFSKVQSLSAIFTVRQLAAKTMQVSQNSFEAIKDASVKVPRRVLVAVTVIVLVAGAVLIASTTRGASPAPGGDNKAGPSSSAAASIAEEKRNLRSQVDTTEGRPVDGRDPSTQKQTSLEQAASSAIGNSTRTDTPAAGVQGDTNRKTSYNDVYGDPKKTGINAAGCFIGYGKPGQQCMQAGLAGDDKVLTCNEMRTRFSDGVIVSGSDRFKLDTNGDGVACGQGD